MSRFSGRDSIQLSPTVTYPAYHLPATTVRVPEMVLAIGAEGIFLSHTSSVPDLVFGVRYPRRTKRRTDGDQDKDMLLEGGWKDCLD